MNDNFLALSFMQWFADKVDLIHNRLVIVQCRQKNYADKWRRPLKFEIGGSTFLKVSLSRSVMRFGKRGKLSPHFIDPY